MAATGEMTLSSKPKSMDEAAKKTQDKISMGFHTRAESTSDDKTTFWALSLSTWALSTASVFSMV